MEVQLVHAKSGKTLTKLKNITKLTTIGEIKHQYYAINSKLYPERQSIRTQLGGKNVPNEQTLQELGIKNGSKLFLKDLGAQIAWKNVFLIEYSGPIFVYLLFYMRPSFIYSTDSDHYHLSVNLSCFCWCFHYCKRLLETLFIHRFSHSTMPVFNLFKNSIYYWGFSAFVSYFINHPLYTPPYYGSSQILISLTIFMICELGNFSIHYSLMKLRPAGSNVRKIPYFDGNPFTKLFDFVSCPNYTYEFFIWLSFTALSQCFPALLFAIAGMIQMTIWALGKHRNYKKEFQNYPRGRKSILPFII